MVWFAASQAGGSKPVTSSSAELKTEQPSQSTESKSDAAVSSVKPDTASATVSESAPSAVEAASKGKDESEHKAVTVEDSDSEEKMDSETSEQNKIEEVEQEVSFLYSSLMMILPFPHFNVY